MASYVALVRQDVCYHKSCDASSWPSSISEFVRSLQGELKIPDWLKSGSVPYINETVIHLIDQLRASDDVSNTDLWDSTDKVFDKNTKQRLHVVFQTALLDCARIQAVIKAEDLTDTPYPKESFLVILVRNAVLNAHASLSSLEDVPVVLPRHFSGEAIPILNYMKKSFYAPLVVTIGLEIPVEESVCDLEHEPSDSDEEDVYSELFRHSPPTMSEFLDACDRTKTPKEDEEEEEEGVLPSTFEAHFLAPPPSAAPPSVCHIPLLCMSDEKQLPVLMSSLLYQRRVWHNNDPLVGLEFSKYDTTIKLFVGWLEDDLSSDRVLPRVHLGEIGTPVELDLSSPSVALVISRLLCGLESQVLAVSDSARRSVGAVIDETRSHSSLAWRIDTDVQEESASILENNNTRDMIIQWVKYHEYSECAETMPPRKRTGNTSVSGSATSLPPPQGSTSPQPSYDTPPSSAASNEKNLGVPEIREPRESADSVPTLDPPYSCSRFAATSEKDDHRVFRWMFDRRVIPQSIPSDLDFREQYSAMTGLIWPEAWKARENLPKVDAALEPCVVELLESVAALKERPGAIECIPVKDFPFDLRILEQSFSAIFQASRRSHEKRNLPEDVYEVAWRHDHDRLLFDFFSRLNKQQQQEDTSPTRTEAQSIDNLEDPRARPTLEVILRLPKSDGLENGIDEESQELIGSLIGHQAQDLTKWVRTRGGPSSAYQERINVGYVATQHFAWTQKIGKETENQKISKLGQFPSTGRCDALGRLLVEIPGVSSKVLGQFSLCVRAAMRSKQEKAENKAHRSQSMVQAIPRGRSEKSAQESARSLTIPDNSGAAGAETGGKRYTMLSSSSPSSMQYSDVEKATESLTRKVDKLRIEPDATRLELPILAVEYKKASDNVIKGTNQLRMYLTASVKFLKAVGIKNFPVYGVQTDGSIVVVPAAVLRDDGFVYLFERLVEKLDISTPLGAWHYATILCRLADKHSKELESKFEEVRENFVASLLGTGNPVEEWIIGHQLDRLKAEGRAKSPPRKDVEKEKQK